MVPSLRSVTVDRSPDFEKADRWHQFFDSVKLKHLVIWNFIQEQRTLCFWVGLFLIIDPEIIYFLGKLILVLRSKSLN